MTTNVAVSLRLHMTANIVTAIQDERATLDNEGLDRSRVIATS